MLTVLAHNNLTGEVKGMNELQAEYEEKYGPGNYLPPINIVYWSFRIMVGLGMLFIFFGIAGLVLWWRNKLEESRGYLKMAVVVMFLPLLANSLGWIITEMGRQPWVVYGLMLTQDGVSPNVSSGSMLSTTIAFTILYGVIAAVAVYLIHRFAKPGAYLKRA
jgi:cytochrome bd ubiquinol oxidase subunit I